MCTPTPRTHRLTAQAVMGRSAIVTSRRVSEQMHARRTSQRRSEKDEGTALRTMHETLVKIMRRIDDLDDRLVGGGSGP